MKRFKETSAVFSVKLAENGLVPDEVQVLRVGKFNHPRYGNFQVTAQTLSEMVKNFDAKVRGIDVAFDYFHESDKEASGWPKRLELREGGTELWACAVEWTPTAQRKLAEKEVRYFSPDFTFKWQDPESGKIFNNVLFGGGLTNRPFVKEMAAIVAGETEGDEMTLEQLQAKVKELEAANLKLTEEKSALDVKLAEQGALLEKTVHTKHAPAAPAADPAAPAVKGDDNNASGEEGDEVAALKKTIADLQAQLAAAQGNSEKVMGEKKKLEETMAMAEKDKQFNLLLTEGKACAAQKDAFIKGDMAAFVQLSQPVNLKPNGSGGQADEGKFEDRVIKLAEEKVKADSKLSKVDAIKLAHKELRVSK